MKLTSYGRREWLGALLIALCIDCAAICCWLIFQLIPFRAAALVITLVTLVWLCIAAFFRDPARKIPSDPALVLSPADGTVRDIELMKNESIECEELRDLFRGRDMLRIGIFLSMLNVHLNRAPVPMKVVFKRYKKGCFHDARDSAAIRENESMILGGESGTGGVPYPVAVKQISGAIARRIVCETEPGAGLTAGETYGMIKFGSRTELYLPACNGFDLLVKVGDPVSSGVSALARILPDAADALRQQAQEPDGI